MATRQQQRHSIRVEIFPPNINEEQQKFARLLCEEEHFIQMDFVTKIKQLQGQARDQVKHSGISGAIDYLFAFSHCGIFSRIVRYKH